MDNFTGDDANLALTEFLMAFGSHYPEEGRKLLIQAVSGADGASALRTGMEVLYGYREEVSEGVPLLLGLSRFLSEKNIFGLGGVAGRATEIHSVACRISEGGDPVSLSDPEVLAVLKPVEEVEEE